MKRNTLIHETFSDRFPRMNTMLLLVTVILSTAAMTVATSSDRVPRQASSNADGFQTEPRRALVRPGESITLLGNAGKPLLRCHFYLPGPRGRFVDFSQGASSPPVEEYEYFGRGLENGECGIRIKRANDEDDGIVECKVRVVGSVEWERCVTTLRVTNVATSELPVFEINPKTATLASGDDINITCHADRPINMCHIYLPGPIFLNFDSGATSKSTGEYRYLGTGLEQGQCGVTLTGVNARLTGYVVCKLGKWPEQTSGAWETDALKVTTTNQVSSSTSPRPTRPQEDTSTPPTDGFQTEPRRALVRPGESIALLGNAGKPLLRCHFYLPGPRGRFVDFSQGANSPPVEEYEYFGRGLENGECGIRIKRANDEDDGIVECKVRAVGSVDWERCVTTLRVTNVAKSELPMFEINPKMATLASGDDINITCHADRPINMCHIYLPGPRYLNLDRGAESKSTSEYRYLGTGLEQGQCGVTLTGVDARLTGYVVCKLGQWPESTSGAWETDALKVTTTNQISSQTSPSPTRPQEDRPTPPTDVSSDEECGRVKLQPSALITNGQATEQGQWPWHVALYQNKGRDLSYLCGGSLISTNAVVTAAHCVTRRPTNRAVDPNTLVLYFGKYQRLLWSEGGVQNKPVEKIHIHPTFNGTNLQGDIAIIILTSPVEYTDYVRHVCLWESSRTGINEVVGKEGTVVGWGYDESGQAPPELMMARMPVVDHQTCIWSYQEFFSQFTSNKTLCAGFRNGTSVCNGDSGGGLVFPTKQSDNTSVWHLRALVSLSAPKGATRVCDPKHYVVFTDVAKYLPWITPYVR